MTRLKKKKKNKTIHPPFWSYIADAELAQDGTNFKKSPTSEDRYLTERGHVLGTSDHLKIHVSREEFQWYKLTLHHRRRSGEDVQSTLNGGHILPLLLVLCWNFFLPLPIRPSSFSSRPLLTFSPYCLSLSRHPRTKLARTLKKVSSCVLLLPSSSSPRRCIVLGLAAVRRRERKRSIGTEVKL